VIECDYGTFFLITYLTIFKSASIMIQNAKIHESLILVVKEERR
jgi:hypothetical protein